METQSIINMLLGLTAFFFGVWVRGLSDSLKELKVADAALVTRVQSIEVLVAGTYVKRDDMDKLSEAIFKKLDRIELKLDSKEDKEK